MKLGMELANEIKGNKSVKQKNFFPDYMREYVTSTKEYN